MSKALRDHEILIVFLFARDTRHFALCAHVTAVTTHHSGIQVEAITPALALEDLSESNTQMPFALSNLPHPPNSLFEFGAAIQF